MQIANYKLHTVETGRFGLDGGAMFGVVPKVLWSKTNPADDKNRITLAMRSLLIVGEGKIILIDTGIGNYRQEKFSRIYAVDHKHSCLDTSLEKLGYNRSQITDVIVTHLHFDHIGGAVYKNGNEYYPAFPNAKYHVQKEHLEYAKNPSVKDAASFESFSFMPLVQNNLIEIIDGEKEIFPNIRVLTVNGHTIAQQLVKISDKNTTLLYSSDLVPTISHIPLPYVMSYDLFPLKTIDEKKKYLQLAVDENWLLYFQHDPKTIVASVTKNAKGFTFDKINIWDE